MPLEQANQMLPRFFRVRQEYPTPRLGDLRRSVSAAIHTAGLFDRLNPGDSIAITAGSRGIHNISQILRELVDQLRQVGVKPFLVPAMGSHGGATAHGQVALLASLGVTEGAVGCPIKSSMETIVVCQSDEGFPVHFDRCASEADHVLVVNRVKPHTRFHGAIESGLMKMMLIGLGKHAGAIVYHRASQSFSFDQIVRSVARIVIDQCRVCGGIAILENGDEETAEMVGIPAREIETTEPSLLQRVREWLPRLPFDRAELLIVDEIGKEISGTGMDTNVIGRKKSDHYVEGLESPAIHSIYVRRLTEGTAGNASGIGIAEFCHQRILEQIDFQKTRINCLTAGHATGAMMPLSFPTDKDAILAALSQRGWVESVDSRIMWIRNTLKLREIQCSEVYWEEAHRRPELVILNDPTDLEFDSSGDLFECF